MTVEFEHITTIEAAIEAVFDFALDIDAHLASMADSGERAVAGTTTGLIGLGETVTWRARHFGIAFTMTSKVTEWDRPRRFVDEQVKGPFRRFHNEHVFDAADDGTTRPTASASMRPSDPWDVPWRGSCSAATSASSSKSEVDTSRPRPSTGAEPTATRSNGCPGCTPNPVRPSAFRKRDGTGWN